MSILDGLQHCFTVTLELGRAVLHRKPVFLDGRQHDASVALELGRGGLELSERRPVVSRVVYANGSEEDDALLACARPQTS